MPPQHVRIVPRDDRIDVLVDSTLFTSYLVQHPLLCKPVLHPLMSADGVDVARGYPLTERRGERADHPHHAGIWFAYGSVAYGTHRIDFWNASPETKSLANMGTIHHSRVIAVESGENSGTLTVESVWRADDSREDLILQRTTYLFSALGSLRSIDMHITLHALRGLTFLDDKEGLLGIRVARFLESASESGSGQNFIDASGRETAVASTAATASATAAPSNGDAGLCRSGVYLTSEGNTGDDAWATRGKWCSLRSPHVTLAILDHPANVNFPTFWHARGYGLFAANPLGQSVFAPDRGALRFILEQGAETSFRYRVLIFGGAVQPGPVQLDAAFDDFSRVKG